MKNRVIGVSIAVMVSILIGCGNDKGTKPAAAKEEKKYTRPGGVLGTYSETDMRTRLYDIRLTVEAYRAQNSRVPQTLEVLKAELKDSRKALKPIEDGDLVFVPNLKDVNLILLYEKNPDARGFRLVFRGNGVTEKLSAEDFEKEKPK